jgi:hypothetical protein
MSAASAEDRALIRDSARGFLADNATTADVRRWMATDLGYDRDVWQRRSARIMAASASASARPRY